ncbi:hypothetical protein ACGFIX_14405 [Nocardia salmonicida]|uniref:hypothetical protein n=1 Tax=Nocardia salmonicida TaxID=53431 RepID=UPI003712BB06
MSRTTNPAPIDDLEAVALQMAPRWPRRVAAWWAGRRDGKAGLVPDAETGLTPYLHRVCAANSTMVESERLRTAGQCAPLDQERARLVEQRERAHTELDTDGDAAEGDSMAAVRARRADQARRARATAELAGCIERIAELDEQRADRVTVGELRIRRCTEHSEQLVAIYWRTYQRDHTQGAELRAVYRVPTVAIPRHPLLP